MSRIPRPFNVRFDHEKDEDAARDAKLLQVLGKHVTHHALLPTIQQYDQTEYDVTLHDSHKDGDKEALHALLGKMSPYMDNLGRDQMTLSERVWSRVDWDWRISTYSHYVVAILWHRATDIPVIALFAGDSTHDHHESGTLYLQHACCDSQWPDAQIRELWTGPLARLEMWGRQSGQYKTLRIMSDVTIEPTPVHEYRTIDIPEDKLKEIQFKATVGYPYDLDLHEEEEFKENDTKRQRTSGRIPRPYGVRFDNETTEDTARDIGAFTEVHNRVAERGLVDEIMAYDKPQYTTHVLTDYDAIVAEIGGLPWNNRYIEVMGVVRRGDVAIFLDDATTNPPRPVSFLVAEANKEGGLLTIREIAVDRVEHGTVNQFGVNGQYYVKVTALLSRLELYAETNEYRLIRSYLSQVWNGDRGRYAFIYDRENWYDYMGFVYKNGSGWDGSSYELAIDTHGQRRYEEDGDTAPYKRLHDEQYWANLRAQYEDEKSEPKRQRTMGRIPLPPNVRFDIDAEQQDAGVRDNIILPWTPISADPALLVAQYLAPDYTVTAHDVYQEEELLALRAKLDSIQQEDEKPWIQEIKATVSGLPGRRMVLVIAWRFDVPVAVMPITLHIGARPTMEEVAHISRCLTPPGRVHAAQELIPAMVNRLETWADHTHRPITISVTSALLVYDYTGQSSVRVNHEDQFWLDLGFASTPDFPFTKMVGGEEELKQGEEPYAKRLRTRGRRHRVRFTTRRGRHVDFTARTSGRIPLPFDDEEELDAERYGVLQGRRHRVRFNTRRGRHVDFYAARTHGRPTATSEPHPMVAAYLEQTDDENKAETANDWNEVLNEPDTECHTGFGLSFEDALFAKNIKETRKAYLAQLNPWAYDEPNGKLLLRKDEWIDLMDGELWSRAQWEFQFHPVHKTSEMHVTYTATWSSPLVPDFQAQLVITEETLNDPSKWNATAVLDADTGMLDMTSVAYDNGVITMKYDVDDVHWSIVHTCPELTVSILGDAQHFHDALAQLAAHRGVMKLDKYRELEHPDDRKQVLDVAAKRLVDDDTTRPVPTKPFKPVDNGDQVPDVGGDRAAWLAKQGALSVDKLNGLDNDEQKAAYIHKCDLRYAKHLQETEDHNNARFVALDHKIDVLTTLLQSQPKEAFVLAPRSTKADPTEADATRELHNNDAVKELPVHTKDVVKPISDAHAKAVMKKLESGSDSESEKED